MKRVMAAGLLLATCVLSGCGSSEAELSAARAQFLLAEEPADPVGLMELRESSASGDVVVVGRIGGVSEPWTKGQALFVISDPSADGCDGHDHVCSEGCPFCSRKQAENESIAVVQFVDPQGRVLPLDARELFGLELEQTVVVRGKAHVDELGSLVLSADGLYIRR
jgi:hypothetical protein